MGAKYQTNASSGFDASPPPDDGSQTAANLVKWATIKTKLATPVKDLADGINTDLVAAFDYAVRRLTASDSLVAGDHMRTVEIGPSVSTIITVTLADAATMTNVYRVYIKNSGTKEATIARATSADTIDGSAADVKLPAGASILLTTNNAADGYLIAGAYPLEITNLTEEEAPADSDTVAIYDLSATALRKVQVRRLRGQLGTSQTSTSGTSIDFPGIPSWAKKITVTFSGVSTNGTSNVMVQIGDSGGLETTGYLGSVGNINAATNFTTGFGILNSVAATSILHGSGTLTLLDAATNTWAWSTTSGVSDAAGAFFGGGSKALSATLDRVSLTTVNGTDAFDAGLVNIQYE